MCNLIPAYIQMTHSVHFVTEFNCKLKTGPTGQNFKLSSYFPPFCAISAPCSLMKISEDSECLHCLWWLFHIISVKFVTIHFAWASEWITGWMWNVKELMLLMRVHPVQSKMKLVPVILKSVAIMARNICQWDTSWEMLKKYLMHFRVLNLELNPGGLQQHNILKGSVMKKRLRIAVVNDWVQFKLHSTRCIFLNGEG